MKSRYGLVMVRFALLVRLTSCPQIPSEPYGFQAQFPVEHRGARGGMMVPPVWLLGLVAAAWPALKSAPRTESKSESPIPQRIDSLAGVSRAPYPGYVLVSSGFVLDMETSLPTVAVPSGDGPSAVVSIDSTCCVTGPLRTALARTAALHRAINL